MKLLFTTVLLFAPKAFASSEHEGYLRGSAIQPVDDERDLLIVGANTKSLSFSVASASSDFCFDAYKNCLEIGHAYTDTSAYVEVEGNAFAVSVSEQNLWLEATCRAYAEAQARVCAFTKVDGDIKVDTTQTNFYKDVSVTLKLKTATMTIALANSVAVAESYTDVSTLSFTNMTAFCETVGNKSIFCRGAASTELKVVGNATSSTLGATDSLAQSGSVTRSKLQINARGSSLDFLNGKVSAFAMSWSFANAKVLVNSMSGTYVNVASNSFADLCVTEHGRICLDAANQGYGICSVDATSACALAHASGFAFGAALSIDCARAYVEATANAAVLVRVSANVACKTTPKLTWTCTGADADTVCSAGDA